jgi:glutathione S-transferase
MLADGRAFLTGPVPSLADCSLYNPVWFIRERLSPAASPLDRLPAIVAWSERMKAFGGGKRSDLPAAEALEIARAAKPAPASVDAHDPSGLKVGQKLSVTPDDTGKVPVTGTLVGLTADRISIARSDERVGEVVVHFPRAGFLVQML